jgi:hypothetical protein
MAFLLYCRVVLFDRIDDSSKAGKAAMVNRLPPRCAGGVNREALQCPITLELMTVAIAQTYDLVGAYDGSHRLTLTKLKTKNTVQV